MKNFLSTIAVVFSFLLLIGCQENSITDPYPAKNSDYEKNGTAEYERRLGTLDPTPRASQIYGKWILVSVSGGITGETDIDTETDRHLLVIKADNTIQYSHNNSLVSSSLFRIEKRKSIYSNENMDFIVYANKKPPEVIIKFSGDSLVIGDNHYDGFTNTYVRKNFITDPITIEPVNKVQQTLPYYKGTIMLESMLTDPYPVMNSYYKINGVIVYEHRLESSDAKTPASQFSVSLQLSISAELIHFCTVCDNSNNENFNIVLQPNIDDVFKVLDRKTLYLIQTFPIQDREDGMVLKCRFLVTNNDLELNGMWLELPDDMDEEI